MANFNTHLILAGMGNGLLASATIATSLSTTNEGMVLWLTGTIGGLLPDIDADNSSSLKVIFNCMALLLTMVIIVRLSHNHSLTLVWLIITGVYLSLRWLALPLFKQFTVHRGSWHSLLAGCTLSLLVTDIAWHVTGVSARFAWLLGIFLAIGYVIHLLLDEICAFDISGTRFKRSFGSACKPLSMSQPLASGIFLLSCAILIAWIPPVSVLKSILVTFTAISL
ncbi:MAG: metal-dependent hydrolase [Endozoicomonadaceae bacterium]|nr:metal-dependent hydrolase [Endozoicomonadaceae bacterium]